MPSCYANSGLYVGLMSGTSVDGIDAALCRFSSHGELIETLALTTLPLQPGLAKRIRAIRASSSLQEVCELDYYLAEHFAAAVEAVLDKAPEHEPITAIGCHGQTVWHSGHAFPTTSVQLGDANRLVAKTGIPVICDFRRRDMAENGQGAPLAPAFHAHCLNQLGESRAILNLGGIANITLIPPWPGTPMATVIGFDTGPANTLLDEWTRLNRAQPCDENGRWAATGKVDKRLLTRLLNDPYFAQQPPKSTGPEHFSLDWLRSKLDRDSEPADVQATLVELTAISVANAINKWGKQEVERLFVCGGGTHNQYLMERLQQRCRPAESQTTQILGIDPDYVEAMAFAWLAWANLHQVPGNLPTVTGARRPVILGGLYRP